MKPVLLIPASLALASRARAQSGAPQWVVGGQDPGDGPANATGASTFRGPDLSADGPADAKHDVSVAVYAEVPANGTRPGALSSVSVVTLRDADAGEADDGWTACLNVWEAGPDVPGGGGLDDPGDCSAVLPDACREGFPSSYGRDGCGLPTDTGGGECQWFLGSGISTRT